MLDKSVLVVAHPDDEVLWFSSILARVDAIIVCFVDFRPNPTLSRGRRNALAEYPLSTLSSLDLPESEVFNGADWQNPLVTPFGLEVNEPAARLRYARQFETLVVELRSRLQGYRNVITHNPWGEYGHEEHVQVHRAVESLQPDLGFAMWFSNYCSNRSINLAVRHIDAYVSDYITYQTDTDIALPIIEIYKTNDCWTWYDDWIIFPEESFMEASSLKGKSLGRGHIFPLNFMRVDF